MVGCVGGGGFGMILGVCWFLNCSWIDCCFWLFWVFILIWFLNDGVVRGGIGLLKFVGFGGCYWDGGVEVGGWGFFWELYVDVESLYEDGDVVDVGVLFVFWVVGEDVCCGVVCLFENSLGGNFVNVNCLNVLDVEFDCKGGGGGGLVVGGGGVEEVMMLIMLMGWSEVI